MDKIKSVSLDKLYVIYNSNKVKLFLTEKFVEDDSSFTIIEAHKNSSGKYYASYGDEIDSFVCFKLSEILSSCPYDTQEAELLQNMSIGGCLLADWANIVQEDSTFNLFLQHYNDIHHGENIDETRKKLTSYKLRDVFVLPLMKSYSKLVSKVSRKAELDDEQHSLF